MEVNVSPETENQLSEMAEQIGARVADYAAIDSHSESIDKPMGKNDVWIAASAHALRVCLLTTDKDFDHLQTLFITREWIDPERDKKS
jgi:tRNA(fMet)-specific endonuclease VapC